RDLKPSNVMVGGFGEVQVMDWGLAKEKDEGEGVKDEISSTQEGSVLGTPAYMAPEQAFGRTEEQDERTDVFGLGGILYEMLTAKAPFAESRELVPPRRIHSSISPGLEAICLKALA